MRLLFFVLLVMLVSSLTAAAQAVESETFFPQQMTARELMVACASSSLTNIGRERQRYCHGFVSGIEEGTRMYGLQHAKETTRIICLPPGTTSRKLASVYLKYASGPHVDLEKPAASIVIEVLIKTFPC